MGDTNQDNDLQLHEEAIMKLAIQRPGQRKPRLNARIQVPTTTTTTNETRHIISSDDQDDLILNTKQPTQPSQPPPILQTRPLPLPPTPTIPTTTSTSPTSTSSLQEQFIHRGSDEKHSSDEMLAPVAIPGGYRPPSFTSSWMSQPVNVSSRSSSRSQRKSSTTQGHHHHHHSTSTSLSNSNFEQKPVLSDSIWQRSNTRFSLRLQRSASEFDAETILKSHNTAQSQSATLSLQCCVRSYLAAQILSKLKKARNHRQQVAMELLTSERSYVVALETIETYFVNFLKWNSETSPLPYLSSSDVSKIFGNIQSIISFNKGLLEIFEERIGKSWTPYQKFADTIVKHAPYLKLYSVYCQQYENAIAHLKICLTRSSIFQKWMHDVESINRLDLVSLLIMPVQRIPRYRLLLEDVLLCTDEKHPDYSSTQTALEQISLIAQSVNNSIKDSDKNRRMVYLGFKVKGLKDDEDLVQPHRNLILEGPLRLDRKLSVPLYCMLFSDVLVIVNELDPEMEPVLTVKFQIPLKTARVKDVVETEFLPNAFQLIGETRCYDLVCKNPQQKISWLRALEEAILLERKQIMTRQYSLTGDGETISPEALSQLNRNPYMFHYLNRCAVRVDGSQIFKTSSNSFVFYLVTCRTDFDYEFRMHKRFSDFNNLWRDLKKYTNNLPPLPPRYMNQKTNISDQVRGERQVLLDKVLQDVILHPELQKADELFSFLGLVPIPLHFRSDGETRRDRKKSVREFPITVTLSTGKDHQIKITDDVFINSFHEQICSTLKVTMIPLSYRIYAVTSDLSKMLLEERDRVWSVLESIGSHQVIFERYAVGDAIPVESPDLELEYSLALQKLQQGMYHVSETHMEELLVQQLLTENPEIHQLVSNQITNGVRDETFSSFIEIVERIVCKSALEMKPLADWISSCLQKLKSEVSSTTTNNETTHKSSSHMFKFLSILRSYHFYGLQFFENIKVCAISTELKVAMNDKLSLKQIITIGVNQHHIKLMSNNKSKQLICTIPHSLLEGCRCDLTSLTIEWIGHGNFHHSLLLETPIAYKIVSCVEWFIDYFHRCEDGNN